MNLTSPSQVREWCLKNAFHPNKVLGQNFLIDRNALEAILDAADLPPAAAEPPHVLEIGPGLGVLTEGLLQRGCRVVAVEKDPVLAARLKAALGTPPNLDVLAADALDLAKAGRLAGFPTLVSNLPYQAGTRILLEIMRQIDVADAAAPRPCVPEKMVVLVQTEVAERLAAAPGSKTRGLAGVWAQLDYDVKIVRAVKASCFWPRPEIGSTVVKLTRHHRNDALPAAERAGLRQLTKQAFEHRRKQLASIFKNALPARKTEAVARGLSAADLAACGLAATARAEELANAEWLALAHALYATT